MSEAETINFTTLITGSDSESVKWTYLIVVLSLLLLCSYLLKSASEKIEKVKDPTKNNSYCVISVTILQTIIANIVVLIIGFLLELFMILNNVKLHPESIINNEDFSTAPLVFIL